jgi:hypothetical protein
MRDYNSYLPHHREFQDLDDQRLRDERVIRLMSTVVSVVALIGLAWLVCMMATDAVVKTAEIQVEHYGKPVAATYQRPAAYRLATPTWDEMTHLEHVRQIAQVRR